MADDPLLSREVDAAGFAAIMATKPVTKLTRPVKWWLDHSFVTVDSTGTPHFSVDTSGRFTEASASTISTNTTNITNQWLSGGDLQFGIRTSAQTAADAQQLKHRITVTLLTSDGAGAIPATTFCPAAAGYTGHARLIGIWTHATDAAQTWTIACTGGTLLGPPTYATACTANCVTQFGAAAANQTGCPVYVRGTSAAGADDNKDLTIACAGYAATETAYLIAEIWYET